MFSCPRFSRDCLETTRSGASYHAPKETKNWQLDVCKHLSQYSEVSMYAPVIRLPTIHLGVFSSPRSADLATETAVPGTLHCTLSSQWRFLQSDKQWLVYFYYKQYAINTELPQHDSI